MERVRTRKFRAALRRRARESASEVVARAFGLLITAGPPDDFDEEEAHAFMSTLKNHRLRMVGYGSPARPAAAQNGAQTQLLVSPNYDECEWSPRYSKEDFAELRRLGYGVADWRL